MGDEEFLVHAGGGELDFCTVAVAAQEDADGRIVAGAHHVCLEPVDVEIHLTGIRRLEGPDFQINENVAAENAVVEDEVEAVMPASFGHAELAGLKAEAAAQLEEELLQVIQEDGFKLLFGIVRKFGETGELKDVRVAEHVGDGLLRLLLSGTFDDGFFVFGEAGALVEEGADLPLQLADGPVAAEDFVFVESPLPRVLQADEFLHLRPR